jgi:hypothetical protein
VDPADLVRQLVDLAEAAGFEVRSLPGPASAEGPEAAASGVCRVRGATWVLLDPTDPIEDRIAVLVEALRRHAPEFLEDRYLPPALRERLGGGSGSP